MISELEKLAGLSSPSTSSEHLQVLAKRAAKAFLSNDSDDLTSAVSSIIDEEDLNKNQIRRVSEMANQAVWKHSFVEGGDRHVSFSPADAEAIISDMDSEPETVSAPVLDYAEDPGEVKEQFDLEEIFKTDGSGEPEKLNPFAELEEAHEKAAAAKDLARYSIDTVMMGLQDVSEEFYSLVKHAHLTDDIGMLQIAKAVGDFLGSEKFATSIMKSASDRLSSEGVRINTARELLKAQETVVVDSEHPLLLSAAKLEKLAQAYNKATKLHKESSLEKVAAMNSLKNSWGQ